VLAEQTVVYRDVPVESWFAPYVSSLVAQKIAEGYRDPEGKYTGEFGVANPITYAEALKILLVAGGKPIQGGPPRNPSAAGTWAAPYLTTAESLQLSVYVPTLDVHAPATRGALIQTLLEVLDFPIAKKAAAFSDVPEDHPYTHAIATAAFYGFVEGDRDAEGELTGAFRPDSFINRAEVSKVVALAREVTR
jgi:hypothetical protein